MTTEAATTAVAIREETSAVMLTNQQITMIATTEFVPKGLRGNVPAVLACVARGRAMGIPDMVALNGIAIINGKATLSAELMVAIVRAHGHSITGDVTATGANVKGKRQDNGDTMTAEFNQQMAEDAGLLKNAVWKQYPDDMMWARAVSKLCRRLFADCFAGGTYAPDDMESTADEVMDEDWAGVTEPGNDAEMTSTGAEGPTIPPDPVPGSVTPLQLLVATYGKDAVKEKGQELFPNAGNARDLSVDDLEALADALRAEQVPA